MVRERERRRVRAAQPRAQHEPDERAGDAPDARAEQRERGECGGRDRRRRDAQEVDAQRARAAHDQPARLAAGDVGERAEGEGEAEPLRIQPELVLQHERRQRQVREERHAAAGSGAQDRDEEAIPQDGPGVGAQRADAARVSVRRIQRLRQGEEHDQHQRDADACEHAEDPAPVHDPRELAADDRGDHGSGAGDEEQQRQHAAELRTRELVPGDGEADHDAGGSGETLQEAGDQQHLDPGGECAHQRQRRECGDADEERPAPAEAVAERPRGELAESEAHHARRHRGLRERVARAERGRELWQLRQVQVHRQRTERLQQPEHEHRAQRAHARAGAHPAHPPSRSTRRSQLSRAAFAATDTTASGEKPWNP